MAATANGAHSAVAATEAALAAVETWNPSTKAMLTVTPEAATTRLAAVDTL